MNTEKVAIITGASRGIGREVARGLAKKGYQLVLIARNQEKLIELQHEIKKFSVHSELIAGDITKFATISKELDLILQKWGRCDVLVNNAGIFIDGTLNASLEDYQQIFDTNFRAQLNFIKTVIPCMQNQGNGYIFNIASIAGKVGYPGIAAYTASKFALVGLSESLHAEYSSQGIKVTSICPDWVATDMASGAPIPENEMIQAKDISRIIHGLLDLSSAAFIREVVIELARKS